MKIWTFTYARRFENPITFIAKTKSEAERTFILTVYHDLMSRDLADVARELLDTLGHEGHETALKRARDLHNDYTMEWSYAIQSHNLTI